MRLPHVTHAEHETQDPVPLAYHGVPAEKKRLRSLFRPGQLGEHHAHHERLDHDTHYALQAHDEYRLGTLFGRVFGTVTLTATGRNDYLLCEYKKNFKKII